MQIITQINNVKCLEWGLNANQGALFDMLNQSAGWAKAIVIDGEVWYWVSRNKVIEELPLYYTKPDTVYRHLKALDKSGLVRHQKHGDKDLIMLTEKGKTWNNKVIDNFPQNNSKNDDFNSSETNPTLGNKSENTRIEIRNSSDSNPTYQHTNSSAVNNQEKNKQKKPSQDLQSDEVKNIEENFFSFFWKNYPKKTGKANCLKKYCVLLKNKTTRQKVHDEIMFGLSQYVSQKEDWCAWKNPLTFLNGKTWEDYTLDKPFEEQPQQTAFLNWKDEAREMENGKYIPGGWGAEVGETTEQWRARFFAWKKVGLQNWWDRDNHCWTFTEQNKPQWLALHKKADGLMGVAA